MITDQQAEAAVAYLRDHAEAAAKARAERLYLDEFSKHLRAKLMSDCPPGMAVGAQERDACASEEYAAHLDGLRAAIEADEKHRFMREAAMAKLECWRSQSANLRGMGK